jgi:hypothetical protein
MEPATAKRCHQSLPLIPAPGFSDTHTEARQGLVVCATSSSPHSAQSVCDEDRGSCGVENAPPAGSHQTILSLRSVSKTPARKARRSWNSGNRAARPCRPIADSGRQDGPLKAAKSVGATVAGDDLRPREQVQVDGHWYLAFVFDTSLPWLGWSLYQNHTPGGLAAPRRGRGQRVWDDWLKTDEVGIVPIADRSPARPSPHGNRQRDCL